MPEPSRPAEYLVVARRYRPQRFEELIGQEHVARALAGAINSQRVGHAYLFTGARGVGKTSAARILAKALNCKSGPTPTPCNQCDACEAISTGDDVDVLEIDGASNRGIDEIRQLRQNVNIRPTRSRFKIYIIDEVHMLTREAFNALLKTLEEPPEHVKFIFCTTEPEKVPITVLSRCQRFDFAGIQARSIVERLKQIAEAEGVQAEPAALEIIARRAAGSMRDSQSLLEQLLAFGGEAITAADVHAMLGTAAEGRLASLIAQVLNRDAAEALRLLDAAITEGVDIGQLIDQLLGYLRDLMLACVDAADELLLNTSPTETRSVREAAKKLGLENILAMMQVLDQSLARMRVSTHRRTLAELAIVRICRLDDVLELSQLAAALQSGGPIAPGPPAGSPAGSRANDPGVKKNSEAGVGRNGVPSNASAPQSSAAVVKSTRGSSTETARPSGNGADSAGQAGQPQESVGGEGSATRGAEIVLSADNVRQVWQQAVAEVSELAAEMLSQCQTVAILAPNRLAVSFPAKYSFTKQRFDRPEEKEKIESALRRVVGQRVSVEFSVAAEEAGAGRPEAPRRAAPSHQRLREAAETPIVRRAMELFGAVPTRVDPPRS